MITNHDQKVKVVRLCASVLSQMLLNNGTYTFVSHLPDDAKLELAGFEPDTFMFFYVYSHESFPMVTVGQSVPIVPKDKFYIQRRVEDAEFATTIK